ncbi:hypothetical protein ACEN8K_40650, partial [Variovorax sp. CT11-76]
MLRIVGRVAASLVLLLSTGWACLALWYQLPVGETGKVAAAVLWSGFGLAALVLLWRGRAARALLSYAAGFALLLGWWNTIVPLQQRDWADDVAPPQGGPGAGHRGARAKRGQKDRGPPPPQP